jgi:hypothetical protein
MIDVHAHVEALFQAASGLRLYDGEAGRRVDGGLEEPVAPYVVVYSDGGVRSGLSLCDGQDESAEFDVEVWSVGTSPRSARAVRSEVLAALVGGDVVVDGRVVQVRSIFSDPLRADRGDPRRVLFEGRDGLTVTSLMA